MPPAANLSVSRGDVVLTLFPNSNLRSARPRPALVIQADALGTGLRIVVVVMITSQLFRAGHPSRVPVRLASSVGAAFGLLSGSVVMTDNIATLSEILISRVIGVLPMRQIDAALRHTLAL